MRIFFSVGEPSGDLHGANLIRALKARRPDVQCEGFGGPRMREAGCALHFELAGIAVMGLLPVLANFGQFAEWELRARRYFRESRPDAVVLIDCPGFNWWIARFAKACGIPVFYYVPPQLWGWAGWRVAKMRRFVDHVLCTLPFEPEWYARRGCKATYVGHPFYDEIRRQQVDEAFLSAWRDAPGPLITILPGSRTQEVETNLPWFLQAAAQVRRAVPQVRFAVAAFKPHQAQRAEEMIRRAGLDAPVFVGRTPELIRAATCCLACSGSVSLELMCQAKPTVIGYRTNRFGYFVQRLLLNVPHITLVNLLSTGRIERDRRDARRNPPADDPRVLFPELLSWDDRSVEAARHLVGWLTDDAARGRLVERIAELRDRIAKPGASEQAADYIIAAMGEASRPLPRPHYLPAAATKATITR